MAAALRILSPDELKSVKGIRFSRQHLNRLIKNNRFPRPLKLGENTNGFVETEIDKWLANRIAERDSKEAKLNMASKKLNPAIARDGKPASKLEQLGGELDFKDSDNIEILQVRNLTRRFAISMAAAAVIAPLAFGGAHEPA